jgi:hypothetical protein
MPLGKSIKAHLSSVLCQLYIQHSKSLLVCKPRFPVGAGLGCLRVQPADDDFGIGQVL